MSEEKEDNKDILNLPLEEIEDLYNQGKIGIGQESFDNAGELFPKPEEENKEDE